MPELAEEGLLVLSEGVGELHLRDLLPHPYLRSRERFLLTQPPPSANISSTPRGAGTAPAPAPADDPTCPEGTPC